ncbi:MAG: GNAT family N-acetyltransferase [Candidatus Eisenbacteria bacterium]|nr:GNAT family N-acetyltransferase [Candidatus Eisenbacteria bacterium]
MTIRRLTPADAAAYRALMLEAYATVPVTFGTSAGEAERYPMSWWEARVAAGDDSAQLVIGAFDGERLVGAAGLQFEQRVRTRHRCTLFGMYVSPAARGTGAGRALVMATLDAARARPGLTVIQLSAIEGNDPALKLYESCGFVRWGTEPKSFALEDGHLTRAHYWRELSAR